MAGVFSRWALLTLVLAACNSTPPGTGTPPDGGAPAGDAITAPGGTWTWVDFPDSSCDDGSATGIGINPSTSTSSVLVFLTGGGACWDATTCFVLHTATTGPYDRARFESESVSFNGSILDRSLAQNPFRDWSFVFVPYCTGDVHAGNNVPTYGSGSSAKAYRHKGHANILAFLRRLGPTFPMPAKLVLAGSSAGGFGALLNHDAFRQTWPSGSLYIIDDSGPTLEGDAIPPVTRSAWYSSWNLGETLDPLCGTACRDDLSQAIRRLTARYPRDRIALLSSLQDRTIRAYFQRTPGEFQTALLQFASDALDPAPTIHYFFIPGDSHTFLGNPSNFSQGGISLLEWLRLQISDDPAWTSKKP